MSSLNRVILIGRVVAQPEMRYTPGGKAVANFRLAVDRRGKSDEADFIPIVAWERLAEICGEFLTKGKLVAIEGRLQTRTYETKEGQKLPPGRLWPRCPVPRRARRTPADATQRQAAPQVPKP